MTLEKKMSAKEYQNTDLTDVEGDISKLKKEGPTLAGGLNGVIRFNDERYSVERLSYQPMNQTNANNLSPNRDLEVGNYLIEMFGKFRIWYQNLRK